MNRKQNYFLFEIEIVTFVTMYKNKSIIYFLTLNLTGPFMEFSLP